MCGIAGIAALDSFDPKLLIAMTQVISYRGPDGFGFAFFGHDSNGGGEVFHNEVRSPSLRRPMLGLGHRRLSILDLSERGSQPMQTEDGTLSITFNGEIYNYLEVRRELQALGHQFKTETDTEVILHAYQEWGEACLTRFNGMWAFALWDNSRQILFCSRDRFGVKPFYYHLGANVFVFGSEIKQILQLPEVRREANESAVHAYLESSLQDHTSETFFKGIYQLPGGSFLRLDLGRGSIAPEIRPYWNLSIKPLKVESREACEEFLARFTKAVNLRMRSDVPVGSCLSGGLDSSSIVCVARRIVPNHEFHTFSSCSDDRTYDEREFLMEVVRATEVHSHQVFPNHDDFWETFERLVWHQDEPFADCSVFSQWSVMQKARQEKIPVLLDGQGGDETLCGYLKFYYYYLWHLLRRANPRFIAEMLYRTWREPGFLSAWKSAHRYLPAFFNGSSSLSLRVCRTDHCRAHRNGAMKLGPAASIPQRQKDDLVRYSVPALFHYEDRNSMAHSIESREPFLDFELAEFLVNLPAPLKMRRGWTKWILRESLKGILPDKVRLRRDKMWFPSPQKRWLKKDLGPKIQQIFSSGELRMSRILDRKKVLDEFAKFLADSSSSLSDAALFRVLNLEVWARVFNVT